MAVCCEADVWVLVGKELGLPYAVQNPFQVEFHWQASEAQTDETNCRPGRGYYAGPQSESRQKSL